MKWIIFNNNSIIPYINFINSHEHSGIWHEKEWLDFQIAAKKADKGFFFGIEKDEKLILAGLFLIQKSRFFRFGYIPAGFLYKEFDEEIYDFLLDNLKKIAGENNLIFTQIDSIIPYEDRFVEIINKKKNHRLNEKLPIPQYTNIIPMNLSEDEILSQMKPKGRYNIRLAEKKGVTARIGSKDEIKEFYCILKETALRDGFRTNNENYYSLMLGMLKNTYLFICEFEKEIIAAGIFIFGKFQGLYYYGASSNTKRNLMAPYLLQWTAIKTAKQKGCRYFDFMGIADPENPFDRLLTVTDFKLKFGGNVLKFHTSYRIVHNNLWYIIYKLIKKLRKSI